MRLSPLVLKDYFITHLNFSARPDFDNTKLPMEGVSLDDLDIDVRESRLENAPRQRTYQVFISLKKEAKDKFPYDVSIALIGAFEIPDWPEHQVDALFNANAPALLYSAAREALASITGQGPYPKVILPSVTFVKPPSEQSTTNDSIQPDKLGQAADTALAQSVVKTRKKMARKVRSS